jgi:hypothetical protein
MSQAVTSFTTVLAAAPPPPLAARADWSLLAGTHAQNRLDSPPSRVQTTRWTGPFKGLAFAIHRLS